MSTIPPKVKLFLLLLIFFPVFSQAQIRIASPYSRFGIGDIAKNNNAWNFSMGGIGIGTSSPYHVNLTNPASYTAFDSSSFVFEGGFAGNQVKLESNIQSTTRNHGSLGYLLFGIPVTGWWRSSIGITPFTEVGYQIANNESIDSVRVTRTYAGEGGINSIYWGNGFRITKDFSAGINASYLFGSMTRQATSIFPDSIFYQDLKIENNIEVRSFYFLYGLQYRFKLKEDLHLTAGAVFAPETHLKATTDMLARSFFLGSSGTEYFKDTIVSLDKKEGRIVVPTMVGGGFSFEKTDKWIAGADMKWQNWKKYKAFGISDSLVNSLEVNAGVELLPDVNNYNNYLKRIRYRLGASFNNTYLSLHGQHIREYAFSVGLGLPLKGSKTALNLGLRFGTRGTTDAGLLKETSLRFVVGFSIYERWFVKRKYF